MAENKTNKTEEVTLLEKVEKRLEELAVELEEAFKKGMRTKEQVEELIALRENFPEDEMSKLDELLREKVQENVRAVEEYNKISARYEQVEELYNILKK